MARIYCPVIFSLQPPGKCLFKWIMDHNLWLELVFQRLYICVPTRYSITSSCLPEIIEESELITGILFSADQE